MSGSKRCFLRAFAAMVFFVAMGYLSSLISLHAGEREVLRAMVKTAERGRTIRLPEEWATPFLTRRLIDIDVEYKVVTDEEFRQDPFPSVNMKAGRVVCPFVVSVECGNMVGNLGAWWGRKYLLNFFGLTFIIWSDQDVVS